MNERATLQPASAEQSEDHFREADRALLEAMRAIPEDSDQTGTGERGARLHLSRSVEPTHDVVLARVTGSNGVIKEYFASLMSASVSGQPTTSVGIKEALVSDRVMGDNKITAIAHGDRVGKKPWLAKPDPAEADELKLKVAGKIDQVREMLDKATNVAGKK